MLAADCIMWCQKEYIESVPSKSESNARLLYIIRIGSETDFPKFIECLNETGQRPVSRLLIGGGTVAHVAIISPANNRERRERRI